MVTSYAGQDLTKANLKGVYLQGVSLARANPTGVDLSKRDLQRTNLTGAILRGANLRNAKLSGANLSKSELQGADLSGADLGGSTRRGAAAAGVVCLAVSAIGFWLFMILGSDTADPSLPAWSKYAPLLIGGLFLLGAAFNLFVVVTGRGGAGANLSGADLTGANLTGAKLFKTTWSGATCPDGYKLPDDGSGQSDGHLGAAQAASSLE